MSIATRLGTFRRKVAGLSLAAMLLSLVVTNVASAATYTDVNPGDWFYTYVEELASEGILDTSKTQYYPAANANRAEAVKLAVEAAGIDTDNTPSSVFNDVPNDAWYKKYVMAAYENGIVSGKSAGKYDPAGLVTRGEFAKMMVNAMNLTEMTDCGKTFPDLANHWSKNYFLTLYCWSAVDGYPNGTAGPDKFINRAEIAKMVVGAMNPVKRGDVTPTEFTVMSATPASPTSLKVKFSKEVDATSGAVKGNYSIVDGSNNTLAVNAASVSGDTVTLETATQTSNKSYTLTVINVTSKDAKPLSGTGKVNFTGYAEKVGGPLTVAVASETPAISTLATRTANNTLLVLDLTGGSSEQTQINGLIVEKMGIYADSSVKVVAYDKDGTRLSGGVTFSDGKAELTFYSPILVKSGTSAKVFLKVNISGTAAGTLGLRVKDAQAIVTNASAVSGTFPLQSPTHNVVDGSSSVATATVDSVTISATTRNVDIGDTAVEVAKFNIAETSSKEDLKIMGITLFNNGSVSDSDLKNFVLKSHAGQPLATVEKQSNKLIHFDLSQNPYVLTKGVSRNFSVFADVVNGATRTAQLLVQNDFDVDFVGATTGASILATADSAGTDTSFPIGDNSTTYNSITINEGTLTVSKDNASPSGDITIGATDAVLGSFEVKALGEDIEIQRVKIDLSSNTTTLDDTQDTTGNMECTASACDLTGSIKLMVDENNDGTPDRSLVSTSTQPTTLTDLWDADNLANLSDFSYTVPAGKSVKLMIVGNVTSNTNNTAAGETVTVGLKDVYHYKKASAKYDTSAGTLVQANQLTVSTSALTVSKNVSYGDQIMVAQSGAKIGSFVLKAGSAEGVDITSIAIKGGTTCGGAGDADTYTNVRLMAGATQFGNTKGTVTFDGGGSDDTSNTYSGTLSLAAGTQQVIDVYADIAASSPDNICITVPASGISGTGKLSGTSITAPTSAVNLQLITVSSSGNLTVELSNNTTVSKQFVAGTQGNQVLLLKLTASAAEDVYLTKLQFRNNNDDDDVAIASAKLMVGTDVNTLVQAGSTLTWEDDSTNPGYVEWTFSGATRPKIVRNGTLYVGLYVDMTSSSEQNVSGIQTKFALTDLDAQGLTTLSASASGGTASVTSGIIPKGNSVATYVDSGDDTAEAVDATETDITVTTNRIFKTGDIIWVDEDDGDTSDATVDPDGFWDPSQEELMVVVVDNGATLTVIRGAFGTTASTYSTAKNIYSLNTTPAVANINGILGNAMEVYNTKPTFSVASDSPTGASTGGTGKTIFKFNVKADANAADPAENKVVLTSVDITTTESGLEVTNLKLYPADFDQNATYVTTCVALSASKWRCTLNTQGGTNEIIENTTRTYVVRADVGSGAGTSNTLETYIASLGSIDAAGDVVWTDEYPTTVTWVYQPGSSEVKPANALTLGANSGVADDSTAPTISSLAFGGTADNALDDVDTIAITFSEAIDPTTVNASLVPGGAAVSTDGSTGDVTLGVGGIVTVTNIATTDVDGGASTGTTYTPTATLNSAGTLLTITLAGASDTGALSAGEVFGDVTGLTTTITDISGNALADSAVNASGDI